MSDPIVIIGGGIIGLSIAYYTALLAPTRKIYIVDSESNLFLSASGFSGGFIVRDWFSSSVLSLAELSFKLHRQVAEENDGRRKWGYSASTGLSLVVDQGQVGEAGEKKQVRGEDWLLHGTSRAEVAKLFVGKEQEHVKSLKGEISQREDSYPSWTNQVDGGKLERISGDDGCAQVEPRRLCEWLLSECQARGVEVLLSMTPLGLVKDTMEEVEGILVEHGRPGEMKQRHLIKCKDIVVSAGSWTPRVFKILTGHKMKIGIKPLAGYSIVVRSPRFVQSDAQEPLDQGHSMVHSIFCPPTSTWKYSPEAMARLDQNEEPEIYVAGLNEENLPLPELAGQTKHLMDEEMLKDLKKTTVALVGLSKKDGTFEDDLEEVRRGLCFRPVSESGLPIISRVDGVCTKSGGCLYVASGHGPWGITLSLGTGFVVAELLQGQQPSADIRDLGLCQDVGMIQARL